MAYSCVYPNGYPLTADEQARYPIGKRFTSLALWEAQNLSLTGDEICEIIPGGETVNWSTVGPDTTAFSIAGWTLNGYRIYVKTIGDNNTYALIIGGISGISIGISLISLIDVTVRKTSGSNRCITFNSAFSGVWDVTIDGCLLEGYGTNNYVRLMDIDGGIAGSVVRVYNTRFRNAKGDESGALRLSDADVTVQLYNNSAYDCTRGFWRNTGTVVAKNNITYLCTAGFFGTFDATSDYNFSSDGTAPGTHSLKNQSINPFVDAANGDFHLLAGAAPVGAGIGPDADSNVPTIDIDGNTRSGLTTDIGADLYTDVGGAISAIVSESLSMIDSSGRRALFIAAINDNMGLADGGTSLASLAAGISDLIQITDAVIRFKNTPGSITDSVNITGAISASGVLAGILSDTINVSGSSSLGSIITGLVLEALGISESNQAISKAIADSSDGISFMSSIKSGAIRHGITFDNLNIESAATFGAVISAILSDALGLSDESTIHTTFNCTVVDGAHLLSSTVSVSKIIAGIIDVLHLTDAVVETSILPEGLIRITLTARGNTVSFVMATNSVSCGLSTNKININQQ